ncbi:MAG: allophanate hydrolase subunit 1 [Candidatus Nanopelagicales bacterium]
MTRVLPYGESAVLLETDEDVHDLVRALEDAVGSGLLAGVVESVPGARTVLVRVDRRRASVDAVAGALAGLRPLPRAQAVRHLVEIEVAYDGPDLTEVARLSRLTPTEVVQAHTAVEYEVAFCGFAPGFAYLTGLDPALHVPRLPTPRTRVPRGAVAIASTYAAVYPRESPGGWRLLGTTTVALFDERRRRPAVLEPGTRVRFVPRDDG